MTLLVCDILKFFYLFVGEANFSQALLALEYWKAFEQSEILALNGIGYCGNTLLALGNDLLNLLVLFPREIQKPFL